MGFFEKGLVCRDWRGKQRSPVILCVCVGGGDIKAETEGWRVAWVSSGTGRRPVWLDGTWGEGGNTLGEEIQRHN